MDHPVMLGVDQIERIEHYGRYTASTIIPPRFIWGQARLRDVDCPMFAWRIGAKRFIGVVPVAFLGDGSGRVDNAAMLHSFGQMIAESKRHALG